MAVALPGFPSSVIVLFAGGARFSRLTIHPSGRLRRRLIQALDYWGMSHARQTAVGDWCRIVGFVGWVLFKFSSGRGAG